MGESICNLTRMRELEFFLKSIIEEKEIEIPIVGRTPTLRQNFTDLIKKRGFTFIPAAVQLRHQQVNPNRFRTAPNAKKDKFAGLKD